MSKTMEEIRAIVATDQGYDSWEDFLEWEDTDDVAYHLAIEYSNQQTRELQEQNAELVELVERCKDVICAYNNWSPTPTGKEIIEAVNERITKYNHLKSNTNGKL